VKSRLENKIDKGSHMVSAGRKYRTIDLPHNLTQLIGEIVVQWAYLEDSVIRVAASCLGVRVGVIRLLSEQSPMSALQKTIRNVSVFAVSERLQADITNVLDRLDHARAERNQYVHGLWGRTNETGLAEVQSIRFSSQEIIKRTIVTPSDLEALLEDISSIFEDLHRIEIEINKAAHDPKV
jgi:hypothetical protein